MYVRGLMKVIVVCILFKESQSSPDSKSEGSPCDCKRELKKRGYIPEYADGVKTTNIQVKYNDKEIKCGGIIGPLQAINPPTLVFDVTGKCKNVTVMIIVPEALFPPFVRWLVINIPATALKKGFNFSGGPIELVTIDEPENVIAEYDIPKGVRLTSTFLILVYCQCQYISDTKPLLATDRVGFDVKKYAKDHGLKCPVAGSFLTYTVTGTPLPDIGVNPGLKPPIQPNLTNAPPTVNKVLGYAS